MSRYEKNVYSLAHRLVSDREDALISPKTFSPYQALPRFRGEPVFNVIHRVCVNASLIIRKEAEIAGIFVKRTDFA